jgi:hypothetical protein
MACAAASIDVGEVEMSSVGRSGTTAGRRARVLAVDDRAPFLALLRDVLRATAHLERRLLDEIWLCYRTLPERSRSQRPVT